MGARSRALRSWRRRLNLRSRDLAQTVARRRDLRRGRQQWRQLRKYRNRSKLRYFNPAPFGDQPTITPILGETPTQGDNSNNGIRQGSDELLNASALRAICVRNDADLETRINATVQTLRGQMEGQQTANDALMGEVQTLRQDVNRLLERLGSLAAATPSTQQPAVAAPEEVVEVPDTQVLGDDQVQAAPPGTVPAAALAAKPQNAENSGLSELMDRLSRLEKARSDDTGNGDSKRSKKGTKPERRRKSRKARRKRRDDDDDDPSSSSSSSSSSDSDGYSDSEDDSRRKRRHKSPVSGVKRFRKKGPRHGDLKPLRATNPLYSELLNYRHYRLSKRSRRSSKHTAKARHQVKNMGLTMLPHRFTGEDPILVLDFLRRFIGEAEQLAMSEDQAYIALPFFLKGQAKSHYEAVMDTTSEGEGGVTCWPEAVQYLLRSYATANHISAAVLALRDVRQHPTEDEKTYSGRLAKAEIRCGNIHTQDEKKTLFIDVLLPAIKAIVSRHRETHDEESYLELLQHAQAEGDTYRARLRDGRRPSTTPLVPSAKVPKASKPLPRRTSRDGALFADPLDTGPTPWDNASVGDASNALMFLGDGESETLTSIPTTDLPSTQLDEEEAQEDPVLAFNNQRGPPRRNVQAPRLPYSAGTQAAAQRPGWEAPRSPRRAPPAQVICHLCYDVDNPHYSPDCSVPIRDRSRIVRNYERLTPEQKAVVPADSYLRASIRITPEGRVIYPSPPGQSPQPAVEGPKVILARKDEGPFPKKLGKGARKGLTATAGTKSHSRSILREPLTRKVRDAVGDCTAALRRPWVRCSSKYGRQKISLMRKRNFKVYADIGVGPNLLARKLSVVDTGAGPNVIRKDELPLGVDVIRHGPLPNVADANNNPIRMTGLVDLVVRLGTRIAKVEFIVCERLAAPVIIGCDFCDRFVEAIYPRKKTIELDDGSTVPIVRRPLKRSPKLPPLPASQEYEKAEGRTSPKFRVSQNIILPPETQTWVSVKSERHGVMVLQPYDKLYADKGIIATNGVVQVQPHATFRVLIANFTKKPQPLVKNQVVATLLPHPTEVFQSNIHLHEVLGLVDEPSDTPDDKANNTSSEVNFNSASLRDDSPESGEGEKPPSVDDVDLSHLDSRYHARVRALLEKYSSMWDGKLGEIKLTEHRIDLVPDARPFAQPPYRAGPKARQIEQEHVDKMLREGVIEPAQSAWASPVVLVPKSDGSLRLCVDYRRLNAISIRDSYPLPRMDESIDSLGEASVFSTIDCNSGYWQIPVRKQDRDKNGVRVPRRTVPVQAHAIRFDECPRDVPKNA